MKGRIKGYTGPVYFKLSRAKASAVPEGHPAGKGFFQLPPSEADKLIKKQWWNLQIGDHQTGEMYSTSVFVEDPVEFDFGEFRIVEGRLVPITPLGPLDPDAGPPMGPVRYQGGALQGPQLFDGRYRGISLLGATSDRRMTLDHLQRCMTFTSELPGGGNLFRVLSTLGRWDHKDFVHFIKDKEEHAERMAAIIVAGAARGVYFQWCATDEPDRNDPDWPGSQGYSRSDNSLLGRDRLTLDTFKEVVTTTLEAVEKLISPELVRKVVNVEVANEPNPLWARPEDHEKCGQWAAGQGLTVSSNTLHTRHQAERFASWPYRDGNNVYTIHMHPDARDMGQPGSWLPATAEGFEERMEGRRAKWGNRLMLSSDGVRILDDSSWDVPTAIRAAWRGGASIEVMSNGPLEVFDPDKEIRLGYNRHGEFRPVTWRGRTTATTRWVYEQVFSGAV